MCREPARLRRVLQPKAFAPNLGKPPALDIERLKRSPSAPIRVYAGDGALWITTNAEWQQGRSQWHADVSHANSIHTGQPIWTASALKLRNGAFELAGYEGQDQGWTAWSRNWSWDLVGGGAQPTVTGGRSSDPPGAAPPSHRS